MYERRCPLVKPHSVSSPFLFNVPAETDTLLGSVIVVLRLPTLPSHSQPPPLITRRPFAIL